MIEDIDKDAVIAHLETENERLRKKLAYLFMKQESLWKQLLDVARRFIRYISEGDIDTLLRVMILGTIVEMGVMMLLKVGRLKAA